MNCLHCTHQSYSNEENVSLSHTRKETAGVLIFLRGHSVFVCQGPPFAVGRTRNFQRWPWNLASPETYLFCYQAISRFKAEGLRKVACTLCSTAVIPEPWLARRVQSKVLLFVLLLIHSWPWNQQKLRGKWKIKARRAVSSKRWRRQHRNVVRLGSHINAFPHSRTTQTRCILSVTLLSTNFVDKQLPLKITRSSS